MHDTHRVPVPDAAIVADDQRPWVTGEEPWVDLRATHSGVVMLLGDRAYKAKLPVRLAFLDFSTREQREEACRRELELNRPLAPDVYLGLGSLEGAGEREPLVVMRRLPGRTRLRTMAERGVDLSPHLTRLARQLAAFHAGAVRSPATDAEGTRDAIAGRWEASFSQVRASDHPGIDDRVLAEIEVLTRAFLRGRAELFADRVLEGRVVQGHGDLLAEDIFCLDDGPRVLDCLDFDVRLRCLDALDDVCCLAMDLETLGRPEAAALLLRAYGEYSGDPLPPALVHHFVAYRAFVRAKVGCLRGAAGDQGDVAHHAEVCLQHLRAGAVRLVLVGGAPGTGKTTLAGALADRLGYVCISSDRVRKELAGLDPELPAPAAFGAGVYGAASTTSTYQTLLDRAAALMGRGESVVLDATWADRSVRSAAVDLAERAGAELKVVRCVLPRSLVEQRIAGRVGPSDADAHVAARVAEHFHPWPEAFQVDTSEEPDRCLDQVTALVRGTPSPPSPSRGRVGSR